MMLRRFRPDHGLAGLSRSDRFLTALRGAVVLIAAAVGARLGWSYVAPAWLGGTSWWQLPVGALIGALLGVLMVVVGDSAAWASGRRQEAFERDRAVARSVRLAQRAGAVRNAAPTTRAAARARPVPRRDSAPAPAVTQVDDQPAETSGELVDAVVEAVTSCGPRGATRVDVGDRLVGLGHDPDRETLLRALFTATHRQRRLSHDQDDVAPFRSRWYDPAQLRVSRELLGQITEIVTAAGADVVDVAGVRSGLSRLGVDPSTPALSRALRVLVNDGVLIEVVGGYVRRGA